MRLAFAALCSLTLLAGICRPAHSGSDTADLVYHGDPQHSGNFVVPTLTQASAATVQRSTTFLGKVSGNVLAQPLYWRPPNATSGYVIVATDQNVVEALDAQTGVVVWQNTSLGQPGQAMTAKCGTKKVTGITGTPVIDPAAGIVYVNASVQVGDSPRHVIYGISLLDGKVAPGWPIDVGTALGSLGKTFLPEYQGQRSGLTLINGKLYVAYGGYRGDCGPYHGWVVGFDVASPAVFGAWSTTGQKAGIWSQGGLTSDGTSLFVTTANGKISTTWADQNAVFRLSPDLQRSTDTHDFYYPSNFATLDQKNLDLGGTAPLPIDVPSPDGTTMLPWLLQFGKDGNAYVLDRNNLGGQDGALLVQPVTNGEIITGPATYRVPDGAIVAISGNGLNCPTSDTNNVLTVLKVTAQPAPAISTLWCAPLLSKASPMITTTDGVSNPIIWLAGTAGDRMLHAWAADTGQPLSNVVARMGGVQRYSTILAAEGRLYVGGGNVVYAFDYTPSL